MAHRNITVLSTPIILTPRSVAYSRNFLQGKFRPGEDARRVFTDAYASVVSFAYTTDDAVAADHYVALTMQTWLVFDKDEAARMALAPLTIGRVTPYTPRS